MNYRSERRRFVSGIFSLFFLIVANANAGEVPSSPGIWHSHLPSRAFSVEAHHKLVKSLRRITGLEELDFTEDGALVPGNEGRLFGGSSFARQLLRAIISTGDIFILENYSRSPDVQFGQLDEGTHYVNPAAGQDLTIWRIRIDPEDFRALEASPAVRASFDEGFTVLHELLHGIGYDDARKQGSVGECESLLNEVRDELGLPRRAEYFGAYLPVTSVIGTVRLRFTRRDVERSRPRWRDEYLFFRIETGQLAEASASCRIRHD